jgi:hypothetical protein
MNILNAMEQEDFESPPVFDDPERLNFFFAPLMFNDAMETMRTATNKVCFIVTAGYFKARRKFFARQFHLEDIEFVAKQIGVNPNEIMLKGYSKVTYLRHQRLILRYFGCSAFDAIAKTFATNEIAMMVRVQFRPKLVLLETVELLTSKKIALPSYAILAGLIVAAIHSYQRELGQIIDAGLIETQRDKLNALLEKDARTEADENRRYSLTLLKKPFQSTQPSKIKVNLNDLQTLMTFYLDLKPVVDKLNLSCEYIRYYAYSVIKARIPQVSRRAAEDRYLHLIAFIVYQTFKLHDTMIDTLLSVVQSAVNVAEKEHKESYYQEREQREQKFFTLADRLGQSILDTVSAIKRIITDDELTDSQKVTAIDIILNSSVDLIQV